MAESKKLKVKKAKKPKKVKEPKKAIKYKLTKEQKKLLKEAVKHRKDIQKSINRAIGVVAVILCIISSGLDVLISKRSR
ncbi:MAG: hypothetical protein HDT40_00070 [Lachnospiraceae bacterium]|nr:hypothetical protein [Lachnospiraceae bacterium]